MKPIRNIRCTLAYAGTHYYGWQKVKLGPSIEESLEKALEKILGHPPKLQAASRTDRGVHAEGQVINFFTNQTTIPLEKLYMSLQKLLPKDISPLSLTEEDLSFHPTLDSMGKEYHYLVCPNSAQLPFHREFSWHFPYKELHLEAMKKAAKQLVGTHDFSAFSPARYKDATRTLQELSIDSIEGGRLLFQIRGDQFLYKMVRNLVGTLIYVGCGRISLDTLPSILKNKDRSLAGMTAPAHGLTLKRVFY